MGTVIVVLASVAAVVFLIDILFDNRTPRI